MNIPFQVRLMRVLFPRMERRRREFRMLIDEIEAQAEDLKRSAINGRGRRLTGLSIDELTHPRK